MAEPLVKRVIFTLPQPTILLEVFQVPVTAIISELHDVSINEAACYQLPRAHVLNKCRWGAVVLFTYL